VATVDPVSLRFILPELTGEVPSPPHDALSAEDRRQHLADHPWSYLGVTRSPDDVEPGSPDPATDALNAGRAQLETMLAEGVFGPPTAPGYFVYRLIEGGHQQTGLVCGVATDDYDSGVVRIHERISQARAQHLARHMQIVGAQSSPIALAFRSNEPVRAAMARAVEAAPPFLDFEDPDGLRQQLWAIADADDRRRIADGLAPSNLYLIDGHHRAAAASADRAIAPWAEQDGHRMLAALFPIDELRNLAFHRIVSGLDADRIEDLLNDRFSARTTTDPAEVAEREPTELAFGRPVTPVEPAEVPTRDGMQKHQRGRGPTPAAMRWTLFDAPLTSQAVDGLDNIDPVRLARQVLRPLLDIDETGSDPRLGYRPGRDDADAVASLRVRDGEAAFLMRPVPMATLMKASDDGLAMPPKSTYFVPKVRSGLFIRIIDPDLH
jgi:uncharacterized protein (DUF1015 family)